MSSDASRNGLKDQFDDGGGQVGAGTRFRRAGALTFSDELLPVELAVRDWARHDPPPGC
jgi:hypothetical protein